MYIYRWTPSPEEQKKMDAEFEKVQQVLARNPKLQKRCQVPKPKRP